MDLVYGALEVTGDFTLRNIGELGYDRDFILEPPARVVRLDAGGAAVQFTEVSRLLLRASLLVPEVTCHFLKETDRASALANFTFQADAFSLEIRKEGDGAVMSLVPKAPPESPSK